MSFEKVHLYVEKYSRRYGEILLDFLSEKEFLYFRSNGQIESNMHLSSEEHEPTMLLIHNFEAPNTNIREGGMITTDMRRLIEITNEARETDTDTNIIQNQARSSIIYQVIADGQIFSELISSTESTVSRTVPSGSFSTPAVLQAIDNETAWSHLCCLDAMKGAIELRVWDVAQGSTNSISDNNNLALFDFGASYYKSDAQLRSIIASHSHLLNTKNRNTLIISHWDIDHYNLLTVISSAFLMRLDCVLYPPVSPNLTAVQVANKIARYCKHRFLIIPSARTGRKYTISPKYAGTNYALFSGDAGPSKNLSGLLMSIYGRASTALLTADHNNYQVWSKMYTPTSKKLHVVVPHHGGFCGKTPVPTPSNPGIAVISVGSNTYKHPSPSVEASYRKAKFRLCRTDIWGHDITINI